MATVMYFKLGLKSACWPLATCTARSLDVGPLDRSGAVSSGLLIPHAASAVGHIEETPSILSLTLNKLMVGG